FEAARNGFEFFKQLQTSDGHWAGEYGGPMFLIPGLIITMYITHIPIPESWRIEIIRYVVNKANPVDGRFWVHTRAVYLPMGYCYGRRITAEVTPLIEQLRQELYVQPFETINWSKARNNIAEIDLYAPHTKILKFCNFILNIYEKLPNFLGIRDISLQESYELIKYEDENTDFLDIAPEGPDSKAFKLAKERLIDYMWYKNLSSLSPEGMMMSGTNGTQVWDTALTALAVIETDDAQIKKNHNDNERCYRDKTLGAWGFSTRDQGYNVSDCSSLAYLFLICGKKISYTPDLVSKERFCKTVDILLSMQNTDGGFASYERTRGPKILEWLNPAEVFGNIMIEYSYPECTACVLTALNTFQKWYPDYRADEIK
ncbi:8111_t:CDS:2, partial [Racocetra fulgida]